MENTINQRFAKIRDLLRVSQKDMATALDVRQATISDIERGRTDVNNKIILALNQKYSVSFEWIYTGKGDIFIRNGGAEMNHNFEPNMNQIKKNNENVSQPMTTSNNETELKYTDIEAIKPDKDIIESNKEFFEEYLSGAYRELKEDNYEYLQIKYYEPMGMYRLKTLYGVEVEELKDIYESHRKLVEILHFLQPNDFLLEKFPLMPSFKEYFKHNEEDWNEDFKGLKDKRLELILKLIRVKYDKEDWNRFLAKLINYMSMYKDFLTYGKILKDKGLSDHK
jgi:DNA-binding XRE family transcriptional regulator